MSFQTAWPIEPMEGNAQNAIPLHLEAQYENDPESRRHRLAHLLQDPYPNRDKQLAVAMDADLLADIIAALET